MLKDTCKCCGTRVGRNQLSPASNHMYKHVRRLRKIVESLAALTDSQLLNMYAELKPASAKLALLRQRKWAASRRAALQQ
jgi:hypothetical protein